jgi:SAM-dependent methyltransferase
VTGLSGSWALYIALWLVGLVCGVLLALRIRARFSRPTKDAAPLMTGYVGEQVPCPVCGDDCKVLDVVDFSKSCEEHRGKFLVASGIPVYYYSCKGCQYCFAPWIAAWTTQEFEERIYNQDYILVDPDYLDARPRGNAQSLISTFGDRGRSLRHLDYGGGAGLLSKLLNEAGWKSMSYDPFANRNVDTAGLGQFDVITAYEVFEHIPDVDGLMQMLSSLLAPDGIVLFSTMISDGRIESGQRMTWWYAAPRNGHISLYSRKSLALLGAKKNFNLESFSDGFHMYYRKIPAWAGHLLRKA